MPTINPKQVSSFLNSTAQNIDAQSNPKLDQLLGQLEKAASNDAPIEQLYASLANVALYMPDSDKGELLMAFAKAGVNNNINANAATELFQSLTQTLMKGEAQLPAGATSAPTPISDAHTAKISVSALLSKGSAVIENSYAELDSHYGAMSLEDRTTAIIGDLGSSGVNTNDAAELRREGQGRTALGNYLENTALEFGSMHHSIYMNAGNTLLSMADKLDGGTSTRPTV